MKSYHEILKQLYSINCTKGMSYSLDQVKLLNNLLGNPNQNFKSIHIAGTNGKGSVSFKVAEGLNRAGYKVGLYTSPHISSFRERFRVCGEMIAEEKVQKYLTTIFGLIQKNANSSTFFEITTLLAFIYFQHENVDYAVIETGLGGRLDATNIVHPILSIITSIGLEHTEILGNTYDKIAKEKAGIIKKDVPVIIGPNAQSIVIEQIAKENNSSMTIVQENFNCFLEENEAIAKKALYHLLGDQPYITESVKINPPCRMELVKSMGYHILFDVAHNPDGLSALFSAIRTQFSDKKIHTIFSLSKTKDIHLCLDIINRNSEQLYFVECLLQPRLITTREINDKNSSHIQFQTYSCMNTAIQSTLKQLDPLNDLLCVTGSFFIMGQARRALGIFEPMDPYELNERIASISKSPV